MNAKELKNTMVALNKFNMKGFADAGADLVALDEEGVSVTLKGEYGTYRIKRIIETELEERLCTDRKKLHKVSDLFTRYIKINSVDKKIHIDDGRVSADILKGDKRMDDFLLEDFPKEIGNLKTLKVDKDFTDELVKHYSYAGEIRRPVLHHTCIMGNRIYTTDSFRMAKTDFEKKYEIEGHVFVPVELVKFIRNSKKSLSEISYGRTDKNETYVKMILDDYVIDYVYKDKVGDPLPYERLVPKEEWVSISLDGETFLKDIKRLKKVMTKEKPLIDMDFDSNTISVEISKNGEKASIEFRNENHVGFDPAYDPDKSEKEARNLIIYNANYMEDIVAGMGETVKLGFTKNIRPFTVSDGSPTSALLCPCRNF